MAAASERSGGGWFGWVVFLLLTAAISYAAWLVRAGSFYESGDDLGYYMGLVGGSLMATLLLYPLRKYFAAHDRMGKMENWFRYHMVLGIAAPLLVLFHARFQTGSMNGAFAFYSMLAVVISGVVGRFIYRHVHRGLYGEHLTLEEVQADLKRSLEELAAVFKLSPEVESRLDAFQAAAFDTRGGAVVHGWRLLVLPLRGWLLGRRLRRSLKEALLRLPREQRRGYLGELTFSTACARVVDYIHSVVKLAQFDVYERLFSKWHMVHVPFLYLLVFSGIVHVVAVHMY